jgi:hypothetical protein
MSPVAHKKCLVPHHDIQISILVFLNDLYTIKQLHTAEVVVEQGAVKRWFHTHRDGCTCQQSKFMPGAAHFQGWHFSACFFN